MAIMAIDATVLEKHLRKTTITSNVISITVALITAISVGYGFYFKTTTTLREHSDQIIEVKTNINELKDAVNNSAIFQGATKEQMKAVQDQVIDVKNSQIRIEEKLDKIILRSK